MEVIPGGPENVDSGPGDLLLARTMRQDSVPFTEWPRSLFWVLVGVLLCCDAPVVWSIEPHPTQAQIEQALERGKAAAKTRLPPDRLYAWFGSTQELEPHGFLMTKLAAVAVMATHFELRSATPTQEELDRVLDEDALMVSVVLFGSRPDFAVDSYMVLMQGGKTIKPQQVRFDGYAKRSIMFPHQPAYRAKVVAAFRYAELDPQGNTTISVISGRGGQSSFQLDFSQFQ